MVFNQEYWASSSLSYLWTVQGRDLNAVTAGVLKGDKVDELSKTAATSTWLPIPAFKGFREAGASFPSDKCCLPSLKAEADMVCL